MTEPLNINWNSVLNLSENYPNIAFNNFDFPINKLLDKKLSGKVRKQYYKPWITLGIKNPWKGGKNSLNNTLNVEIKLQRLS